MMFLWFVIIAVLVYLLVGGNLDFRRMKEDTDERLNERLAKGEINIDEYKEIKKTIKENRK